MLKNEIKSLLPEKLLHGVTRCQGKLYSFPYFVQKYEEDKMNSMTPQEFVNYLVSKYYNRVVLTNKNMYINRVIKELKASQDRYEENIILASGLEVNVEEYLREAFLRADEEFLISWGENRKDIYEVYEGLIRNKYVEMTEEDKKEILESMLEYIDPSIRNSIITEVGLSVEDYIMYQLPDMMINSTEVMISGNKYELTEVVKRIVDLEYTRNQEREEQLNRTKENPSLVTEIGVELNKKNNDLETTLEVPVILSDNDIKSLETNVTYSNKEKYFIDQFRRMEQAINNASTVEDLNTLTTEFYKMYEEVKVDLTPYINGIAQNINLNIIPKKERELHIFKNNSEDYVDAMVGKIRVLKNNALNAETETDLNELQNEVNKLEYEVGKRVSSDKEFSEAQSALYEVEMVIEEKRNTIKILPNKLIINQFIEKIIDIKKLLLNIEYNANKAEIVGYSIKFEYAKSDFYLELNNALEHSLVTEEEYEILANKIDKLEIMEKSSVKSKGGM